MKEEIKGCGKRYSQGRARWKRDYICGGVGVKGELVLCPKCKKEGDKFWKAK